MTDKENRRPWWHADNLRQFVCYAAGVLLAVHEPGLAAITFLALLMFVTFPPRTRSVTLHRGVILLVLAGLWTVRGSEGWHCVRCGRSREMRYFGLGSVREARVIFFARESPGRLTVLREQLLGLCPHDWRNSHRGALGIASISIGADDYDAACYPICWGQEELLAALRRLPDDVARRHALLALQDYQRGIPVALDLLESERSRSEQPR